MSPPPDLVPPALREQQVRSASPHSFPNLRAGLSLVSTPSLQGLLQGLLGLSQGRIWTSQNLPLALPFDLGPKAT